MPVAQQQETARISVYARLQPDSCTKIDKHLSVPNAQFCGLKRVDDTQLCVQHKPTYATSAKLYDFSFERVFSQQYSNTLLFDALGSVQVGKFLQGSSQVTMCYGSSGTGKTYTLYGERGNHGFIQRAVEEVFSPLEASVSHLGGSTEGPAMEMCYFQLHLGKIKCMLDPFLGGLAELKGAHAPHRVAGAYHKDSRVHSVRVSTSEQVLDLLTRGQAHREIKATMENKVSSRSHCVFQLRYTSAQGKPVTFTVVDLAGSEQAESVMVSPALLAESKHINRSLLSLQRLIQSMSTASIKKTGKAKPTSQQGGRDSLLTRLLMPVLSGRALCTLILTSSCASHAENTRRAINTFRFGNTAKAIRALCPLQKPKRAARRVICPSCESRDLSRSTSVATSCQTTDEEPAETDTQSEDGVELVLQVPKVKSESVWGDMADPVYLADVLSRLPASVRYNILARMKPVLASRT